VIAKFRMLPQATSRSVENSHGAISIYNTFIHMYRELNTVADGLSKEGQQIDAGLLMLEEFQDRVLSQTIDQFSDDFIKKMLVLTFCFLFS
jgi:hypothetical protein